MNHVNLVNPVHVRTRADIGAEGLRKTRQQGRRQRFANHPAHAGDADFKSWYRSHNLGYSGTGFTRFTR